MSASRESQANKAVLSFSKMTDSAIIATRLLVEEGIKKGDANALIGCEAMELLQQSLSAMLASASISFIELARALDKIDDLSAALDSQRIAELESSKPINEQAKADAVEFINRVIKGG